jgi:hypothetical protein
MSGDVRYFKYEVWKVQLHKKAIHLSDSETEKTAVIAYLRTGTLSQSTVQIIIYKSNY